MAAGGPNALAVATALLGDESTLWLLATAVARGFTRFSQWERLGVVSSSVLAARLVRLVDADLMMRVPYPGQREHFDYQLTHRGRSTWANQLALWDWERRWAEGADQHLPSAWHRRCGASLTSVLVCRVCRATVVDGSIDAGFGPSGSWERMVPVAATRRRSRSSATAGGHHLEFMTIVGNRWSAMVLGAAFLGARRFGEFTGWLGAPPNVIADRLQTFVRMGVLHTAAGGGRSDRVSYELTDKGRAFYPAIATLVDWAQRWYRAPEGPALVQTHNVCGHRFVPLLVCRNCRHALEPSTFTLEPVSG